MATDKRVRNTRVSKYRPRNEAQKARRKTLKMAKASDRVTASRERETVILQARLAELETLLRDEGRVGVHVRRNSRPLESITDDAERFAVLKARVERLDALWTADRRKRETRGKIVLGGAILAELAEQGPSPNSDLSKAVLSILDRRVETIRDRITLRDLLGGAPLALRRGGSLDEDPADALKALSAFGPAFDHLEHSAVGEGDHEAIDK